MKTNQKHFITVLASAFLLCTNSILIAQNTNKLQGSVERIKVHGKGLEGNLEGDDANRDVSIYLPPGYKKNPSRRYPVVYFLHGYTDSDAQWYGFVKHWINMPAIVDSVFASAGAQEMILVTPNAYTRYQGSMYSNSVTTGNWEDFVAKELVAYVDSRYRTIAKAASRGLAGHSMGGYGTLRIGQKYPGIFSSIYMLSPCCLAPDVNNRDTAAMARMERIKTVADFEKADFGTKAAFASAAAWSPDPTNPPLYLALPFKNGQMLPEVQAKLIANRPLATLDQNIYNLKQLNAIAFDAGDKDAGIAATIRTLDKELNKYGIKHEFEIYDGNHINHVADRIEQKMLKFFSNNLS
ncbi:MAG: esterase, partial [Segetibacter sp.]|nr:esterase [Segetibacter sp.]